MFNIAVQLFILISFVTSEQPDPSCLECICQASSNCDIVNLRCQPGSNYETNCGPYQISRSYWEEGNAIGYDFETCTSLRACAERVIINYMKKASRDCNGDGVIDCIDYAAIHRMGSDRCNDPSLFESEYFQSFNQTQCVVNPSLESLQSADNTQQTLGSVPKPYPGQNNVSYPVTGSAVDDEKGPIRPSLSPAPPTNFHTSNPKRKYQTTTHRPRKPAKPSKNETSLVPSSIFNNYPVNSSMDSSSESLSTRSDENMPSIDNRPDNVSESDQRTAHDLSETSHDPFHNPSQYSTHRPAINSYSTIPTIVNDESAQSGDENQTPRRFANPMNVPSSFNQPMSQSNHNPPTSEVPQSIPHSMPFPFFHPSPGSFAPSPMVPPSPSFESLHPYSPKSSVFHPNSPRQQGFNTNRRNQAMENQKNNRRTSRYEPNSSSQPSNQALFNNHNRLTPTTTLPINNFPSETARPITSLEFNGSNGFDGMNSTDSDSILPSNPIPPYLTTNKTLIVSDQCLSCLCASTESCHNKGCASPEGPCGPYQVTLDQWIIAGKPKNNFQKCASSLDCSRGILRRFLVKYGSDCNADADVNCIDFALIHKYGPDNCKVIPEDLMKSGYWLNFENCYGFDM